MMPDILLAFLENLNDEDALQVAAFIGGEMFATDKMTEAVVDSHPDINWDGFLLK